MKTLSRIAATLMILFAWPGLMLVAALKVSCGVSFVVAGAVLDTWSKK